MKKENCGAPNCNGQFTHETEIVEYYSCRHVYVKPLNPEEVGRWIDIYANYEDYDR